MLVAAIDFRHGARARREGNSLLFASLGRPMRGLLAADVNVQIARETSHVAQHLIGDHIRKQPAHVRQYQRVFRELIEDIVFEAGRGRLHPPQAARGLQQRWCQLAEKCVRVLDCRKCLRLVGCIDHAHAFSGFDDSR